MDRRDFLKSSAALTAAAALPSVVSCAGKATRRPPAFNYISAYGVQTLRIWSETIREPVHLFAMADTHLFEADERNAPYHQYSARMERAYNQVPHYKTLQPTTPATAFKESLELAAGSDADAIIHLGDLLSYPSEYSIEYAAGLIQGCGKPFYYVSGNHDWNYEGLDDEDKMKAREAWIHRLKPLYREGVDPLMYSVDIKGVKLIFIDDSADDVTSAQIDFFRQEVAKGLPCLLLMHIGQAFPGHDTFYLGYPKYEPAYSPDKGLSMRSKADGHHAVQIERFFQEVLQASQEGKLLATIVGHEHDVRTEEVENHRQFALPYNANGSYTDIHLLPFPWAGSAGEV